MGGGVLFDEGLYCKVVQSWGKGELAGATSGVYALFFLGGSLVMLCDMPWCVGGIQLGVSTFIVGCWRVLFGEEISGQVC